MAAFLAVVALVCALSGTVVDDEGWLTFIGARAVWEAPLAGIFMQKFHPTLSLLYAPFAALGWKAFLVVHVLIGVGALLLAGATARRWTGNGWITILVMGLSPIYFVSLVTGQSNSSGIFFLALTLFLYRSEPRWAFASGIVAGATIWTRFEQIPYVLGLLAYSVIQERDWRFALGFASIPVLYVSAGAFYHGDLLWILTYPPNNVTSSPGTQEYLVGSIELSPEYVARGLYALFLVSPLWLLPIVPVWRSGPPMVKLLAGLSGVVFILMVGLPLAGHWFNFETTSRYLLNLLLPVAIIAGWALSARPATSRARSNALLACLVAVAILLWGQERLTLALAPLPIALLSLRAGPRIGAAVVAASLLFAVLWTLLAHRAIPDQGFDSIQEFSELSEILASAPNAEVYTDSQTVGLYLQSRGLAERTHVLVGYDVLIGMDELLNKENGQSETLWRVIQPNFYGGALWPCQFPHRVNEGDLLVIADSRRAHILYDVERWVAASERVGAVGRRTVYRNVQSDLEIPYLPPPQWLDEDAICAPCPTGCPRPVGTQGAQ